MLEIGSRLVLISKDEVGVAGRQPILLAPLELLGPAIVWPPTHESTLVCLEHLDAADVLGKTVLDIGTGSGILAIAAMKLGAYMVCATEVEPIAMETAKRNAALNEVEIVFMEAEDLDYLGEFDIVIANLGGESGPDPRRHLAPAGELIVSLKENDDALEALKSTRLADGWVFTHHA